MSLQPPAAATSTTGKCFLVVAHALLYACCVPQFARQIGLAHLSQFLD